MSEDAQHQSNLWHPPSFLTSCTSQET